jgi:hypothetical protein
MKFFLFLPTYNPGYNLSSKQQDGLQFPRYRKEMAEILGAE